MIIDYAIPIHNIHIFVPLFQTKSQVCAKHIHKIFGIQGAQNQAMVLTWTTWADRLVLALNILEQGHHGLVCQNLQPLEVVTTSLLFMPSKYEILQH